MTARTIVLLATLVAPAAAVERRWAHQLGPRPRSASIAHEWRDGRGACAIEFATSNAPQLKINLTGFGSASIDHEWRDSSGACAIEFAT